MGSSTYERDYNRQQVVESLVIEAFPLQLGLSPRPQGKFVGLYSNIQLQDFPRFAGAMSIKPEVGQLGATYDIGGEGG